MRLRVDQLLPIALMLLLGALTLWLRQLIELPLPADAAGRSAEPLAVVEGFTVTQLDVHGSPEYRLSAKRMEHYGKTRLTELVAPMFVRNDPDATTTVSAERGRVDHDYRQAHFHDNVELTRVPAAQSNPRSPALRLRTEYLHVLPDRNIARTDRRVVISQGESSLTGVGMEYNRENGQLRLLSSVRGTFHARPKK